VHTLGRALVVASLFADNGLLGTAVDATVVAATVGSVGVVGGKLVFQAYPDVVNKVETWPSDATHTDVADKAGPLDVGAGCVRTPIPARPTKVTCDVTGVTSALIDGGNLDDHLFVRDPMSAHLLGGPGNDTLTGWAGDDVLDGGDGNDILSGGPGNDLLIGGPGADTMSGGDGTDTASYDGHLTGVIVDPDGEPDDGATGERDNVATTVENLVGGRGDDTLGGSAGRNVLDGLAGADTISGGEGDDELRGGPGADRVNGDGGRDRLFGDAGYDTLDGGTGPIGLPEYDTCEVGADGAVTRHCEVVR